MKMGIGGGYYRRINIPIHPSPLRLLGPLVDEMDVRAYKWGGGGGYCRINTPNRPPHALRVSGPSQHLGPLAMKWMCMHEDGEGGGVIIG